MITGLLLALLLAVNPTSSREEMHKKIDSDFRAWMSVTHPELKQPQPGFRYEPDYTIWLGKNWRKYPGFWPKYGNK